jgi:ADP-ribosylglycohydrolase
MQWLLSEDNKPYNSWGNGSAMRVSPVGFAFNTADEVLEQAKRSAEVTHNHPEGIKGAQAVALSVFLARTGKEKDVIKKEITERFNYDLDRTTYQIRPRYCFDISCQGTVPEAIICFIESGNFENAIRKAISLGGDSDTLACITGGIAQAYYKEVPADIIAEIEKRLPKELFEVVKEFNKKYIN